MSRALRDHETACTIQEPELKQLWLQNQKVSEPFWRQTEHALYAENEVGMPEHAARYCSQKLWNVCFACREERRWFPSPRFSSAYLILDGSCPIFSVADGLQPGKAGISSLFSQHESRLWRKLAASCVADVVQELEAMNLVPFVMWRTGEGSKSAPERSDAQPMMLPKRKPLRLEGRQATLAV